MDSQGAIQLCTARVANPATVSSFQRKLESSFAAGGGKERSGFQLALE
jgi:hypothetical protein